MTSNLHPLFVHFPIALLFIYSFIKIIPFQKLINSSSWKLTERVLLTFGVFGAFIALSTGETAEKLFKANPRLVEMHSTFASISTLVYSILLLGEILLVLSPYIENRLNPNNFFRKFLLIIKKVLNKNIISILLAFIGLLAISTTGLLGGVIVYGTTSDPLANFVLSALGIGL